MHLNDLHICINPEDIDLANYELISSRFQELPHRCQSCEENLFPLFFFFSFFIGIFFICSTLILSKSTNSSKLFHSHHRFRHLSNDYLLYLDFLRISVFLLYLRWYRKVFKSFFIWIELSSTWGEKIKFFVLFLHFGAFSHLRNSEYPEPALAPSAMLLEQEGKEHEQAAVVHDPPDIDVTLDKVVGMGELLM